MRSVRRFLEARPIAAAVTYTVVGVLPLYLTSAQSTRVQDELGFDTSEFGIVVAAFYVTSAIASKRVGPYLDRAGTTRGFGGSAVLTIVASLLIAATQSGWVLVALALGVAGVANSFGQVASNLAIATVVRGGRQGIAFSAKQAAVPVGAMLAGLAIPWVGEGVSWRVVYIGAAVVAGLLLLIVPRYEIELRGRDGEKHGMTLPLLTMMITAGIGGGVGNTAAAFAPDAAVAQGFSEAAAATLLTVGSITAISVRIGAGLTADRRRGTGLLEMTIPMVVAVVGLTMLSLVGDNSALFVTGLLLTLAGAWGWQGVIFYFTIRTIDMPPATLTGAVASGAYLGTVVTPPLVGAVVDRLGYAAVFPGAAVLMAAGVAAAFATHLLGARRRAAAA